MVPYSFSLFDHTVVKTQVERNVNQECQATSQDWVPNVKSKMQAKLFSAVFNFNVFSQASKNDVITNYLPISPPPITLHLPGEFKSERRAEIWTVIKFL